MWCQHIYITFHVLQGASSEISSPFQFQQQYDLSPGAAGGETETGPGG